MTILQGLLLLTSLTGSWGLYLRPCYLDLKNHVGHFPITCHDVRASDQVTWQYQRKDGSTLDVGFCNPRPDPCVPKLNNFMSLSRPLDDRSVLVVKNATRFLFTGAIFRCITFNNSIVSDSTSCRMDVIRPPTSVSISVQGSRDSLSLEETPGQTLALDCVTNGLPCPSLSLFKNGVELKREVNAECEERNATSLHFLVMAVCESTGNYSCVASNSAGQLHARSSLDVLCAPREPTFFVERHRVVSADRNVTLDVISNPSPTTFRFQRQGLEANTSALSDPEAEDLLRCSCSRVGGSSQHVCTVFTTGQITDPVTREYGLDIGNSIGRFRFNFRLNATFGAGAEHSRPDQPQETSVLLSTGGVIAVIVVGAVIIVTLVVTVVFLVYRLRRVKRGMQETTPKTPRCPVTRYLNACPRSNARGTQSTGAHIANPSANYTQYNGQLEEGSGGPSYVAPEPPQLNLQESEEATAV